MAFVIQSMVVDGITSVRTTVSGTCRYFMSDILDHEDYCLACLLEMDWWNESMRWTPDIPILRFTSDGLQVLNCVSPNDVQSSVSTG